MSDVYDMDAQEILHLLARAEAHADVCRAQQQEYEEVRRRILAPVQAELDDLDAELQPRLAAAERDYADLREQIKQRVVRHGHTVTGQRLQAVYANGRAQWNTKQLLRIAKRLPEVADCYTEGMPSVSIRHVVEK